MDPIRVVRGSGTGPTPTAAYDAALQAAGVENYNLVTISSVIPAEADVEVVDTAPSVGAIGDRLTVVEARATGPRGVAAALSWGRTGAGHGLFYEGTVTGDGIDALRRRASEEAEEGLDAGADLRGWALQDPTTRTIATTAGTAASACAVVLAVYGEGDPILE